MEGVPISDGTLDDLVAVDRNRTELAACLRGAVKAMEVLAGIDETKLAATDIYKMIERSQAALKEYDK